MPDHFSVIIPAYNGARYLGQAIQSVLEQTYPHFEVIVVDDASPDHTGRVAQAFDDARVKYVRHETNRGAVAARYTGVCASTGDVIALLDQDDLFHPEKLATHAAFLEKHADIGLCYNARFELRDDDKSICGLWQPPERLSLADLVLGYPISPSDTVLRRRWALRPEVWEHSFVPGSSQVIFNGQEIVFGGRLALGGCRFGNVGRALNYRRFHSSRRLSSVAAKCEAELACQRLIFDDPRCPEPVRALRAQANSNILLMWAYAAFVQDDVALGRELLSRAVKLQPALLDGRPCELVRHFAATSTFDKSMNHETVLAQIMGHLPENLKQLAGESEWAVAHGYLLKGMEAVIWEQSSDATLFFERAAQHRAIVDDAFIRAASSRLMDYETEFGPSATHQILDNLTRAIEKISGPNSARRLMGNYWIHRAFANYRGGVRQSVPGNVLRGVMNDPRFLSNRGVGSILLRSLSSLSRA